MKAPSELKLSNLSLAALWFGAAVSLAEIVTGGLLSPLGWAGGTWALVAGHILGGVIFFGAGWVAWTRGQTAIGTVDGAFGTGGKVLFGILNVLQLVGWTAVMVITGAQSLASILQSFGAADSLLVSKLLLGGLLLLWTGLGFQGIRTLNLAAVVLLLGLTVVMGWEVFGAGRGAVAPVPAEALRFGDGLELSVLMPLSWLPLVGDYSRRAKKGFAGNLAGALGYLVGSSWMYLIGLGSTLSLGTGDPTQQMVKAGLGFAGLAIVILSTVTTGFLDVFSAGISLKTAFPRVPERLSALVLGTLGLGLALIFPMDQYTTFLGLLGAVFAPLFAIILAHHFLVRGRSPIRGQIIAFAAWSLGAAGYYPLQNLSLPLGATVPDMILTAIIYLLIMKGVKLWKRPQL